MFNKKILIYTFLKESVRVKSLTIICYVFCNINLLIGQNYEHIILHPYRQFETSTTNENGFVFKNHIMYLSALFDGHIYEYDLRNPNSTFIDRFKLRGQSMNLNSTGSMFYDDYSGLLFAATSVSFERIPEIYIFNTNTVSHYCPTSS